MEAENTDHNDVFTEEPPIVDCDVLEAAKENIQPLAAGRRVTTLSVILSTPHAQREAQLLSVRKRLRVNVQIALEDDDDNPLEAYCRFVYWTLENYPQGQSAESGLLELIEEATRVLKDDRGGRWRGDIKYLKLWVLYASYVERPAVIYQFLLANDIGTDHALLYEEHAAVLERAVRRSDADNAYLLGIARKAEPLDRLKGKHREFQKRMMTSTAAPPPTRDVPPAAPRTVLRTSSVSSARASSSQGDVFASTQPTRPTPNGRLQVFVDPSGSDLQEAPDTPTPWSDVGTRKTRVKENVPEVRKAGGTTLKQAGRSRRVVSASGSATSRIVPFRDPGPGQGVEVNEMLPPPVPISKHKDNTPKTPARNSSIVPFVDGTGGADGGVPSTPKFTPFRDEADIDIPATPTLSAPETIMRPKSAGAKGSVVLSEAEALRKDPLKNYDVGDRLQSPVDG
ncbi:hypothetical protein SERLA73DRAFT_102006 [Serpula lacrymans var. lacrymans S7.3]|uniref:BUB1 N-terminal domain-containing protein n=2 Tax=Serpula lacrymans var. lacrymans TaxID=341189 RepID=F8PJB7_SERL3|nr:uncharacterized protein SERLADRAFT_445390 [Serpula lacrymans var. lacrymans S7.9]EGO03742.1 hypothetical protein SERLA73DRAFT_102006 [Serpula lacrymans var. lacrymans S7.3]EGO29609.1 hypothetical protein SERLADRAFT_445390 [Serpula lacrymans var. lacrymans S7.9]